MEAEAMDEDAPEPMEGEMMMELPAAEPAWNPYEGDGGDYSGAGNLPAFLLSASCKQPYFGDMLRRSMIEWEFNADDKPDLDFENACGMMAAAAESGSAKKEVWIAGCHGEEDWGAIQGMLADKENATMMFPGAVACWTSEENAKKALEKAGERSGQQCQKVLYKVEATGLEAVHCRFFAHRLSAKFGDAQDDVDNKTQIINLTALEGEEALKTKKGATIPEWREKLEEERKAAEAAANAPAEEPAMMEGEGMMDGEAMMEAAAAE